MAFSIEGTGANRVGKIAGNNGDCGKVQEGKSKYSNDESIIFGGNALKNFSDFSQNYLGKPKENSIDPKNPPGFEVKYMPEKNSSLDNLNAMSLVSFADEDLKSTSQIGKKLNISFDRNENDGSVSLDGMNKLIQKQYGTGYSYNAFDIDNNGRIDPGEQGSLTAMTDMSNENGAFDGKITRPEAQNSKELFNNSNFEKVKASAGKLYEIIMNKFIAQNESEQYNMQQEASADNTRVDIGNPNQGKNEEISAPQGYNTEGEYENQQVFENKGNSDGTNEIPEQQTETPVANPQAAAPEQEGFKFSLKAGQGLGDVVLANKELFAQKYGTTKLWGDGGLVDQFAKANDYKGYQDTELIKLNPNIEYKAKV